jgi:hypothetical protein
LWDIVNRFKVAELLSHIQPLDATHAVFASAKRGAEAIPEEAREVIVRRIVELAVFCSTVGFEQSRRKITQSLELLVNKPRLVNRSVVSTEVRNIREAVASEAGDHIFILVSKDRVIYAEQERLFGDKVYEQFWSARKDVTDAGNALAVELPNAAVFHLMRVAEVGLRALARDRRVKLPKKGQPLELAT